MGKKKDNLELYRSYLPDTDKGPGVGTVVAAGAGVAVVGYVALQIFQVILALLMPVIFGTVLLGGAYAYHKWSNSQL